jgi:hypothetical protein
LAEIIPFPLSRVIPLNSRLSRELSTIADRMRGARVRRESDLDTGVETHWLETRHGELVDISAAQYRGISGLMSIIQALN